MKPQHIFFVCAVAFPLALLLNNILEISKLMDQIGIFVFCTLVVTFIYYKLLKKKNMDGNKIFNQTMTSFIIITLVILFIRGCLYIYEVGGLKTAKGLFTFLGLIVIIICGTQLMSMHHTFNALDDLYKLGPNNKATSNKTANNKATNNKTTNNKATNNKATNNQS